MEHSGFGCPKNSPVKIAIFEKAYGLSIKQIATMI
jgi:hypothetical protein